LELQPCHAETSRVTPRSKNAKPSTSKKGTRERGVSKKEAERRAWATVNKESGGGKKSGSGRGKKKKTSSSKKGGKKGGKAEMNFRTPKS
jgi:hypothetical protein